MSVVNPQRVHSNVLPAPRKLDNLMFGFQLAQELRGLLMRRNERRERHGIVGELSSAGRLAINEIALDPVEHFSSDGDAKHTNPSAMVTPDQAQRMLHFGAKSIWISPKALTKSNFFNSVTSATLGNPRVPSVLRNSTEALA